MHSGKKKKKKTKKKKTTDCNMYGYLPWYDYFITVIINIIINLNILDIDVFSPTGNQHQVNIYLLLLFLSKTKEKVILCYAGGLYQ